MLSYGQQDQKVSEEPFIRRVAQGGVVTAIAIMAEDIATPGHAERAAFAAQFLGNPVETGRRVARGVVSNANCGNGDASDPLVSDDTLAWVLASLWNAYAGVTTSGAAALAAIPKALADALPQEVKETRTFWQKIGLAR